MRILSFFTETLIYIFCICRVVKRSLSDGNIPCESDTPMADKEQRFKEGLSDSTPHIRTCENDLPYCRSILYLYLYFIYHITLL